MPTEIVTTRSRADGRLRLGPSGATALGLYLLVALISLLQQPGLTTYDTRAELTQRPTGFLAEAFTLWHPDSNFGEFQNQAYGFLFPQGTWFVLTDLLAVPDWVSQRIWSALVLVIAIEGARRVAGVVGLSGPAALLAGLAFGFSPRLLGTVSVITGEALPGAVLPWVVLPILLTLTGRLTTGRAAVLSGAAIVCMGGVNAVENAGSLPLALILVIWGVRRGLAPRRFLAQWAGAAVLASLWWALPLLVLGRYAPPFYEYVESAANTTAIVGWSEAVRGDSHWVAYLITGDQSWWPAAHDLVSRPGLILLAATVTAIGVLGLARLDHALRGPLVLAAVVGLAALTVAHGSWEGSPVSGVFRTLLDGPLQIFRNVHKVDPTVRLPLAIGFGHAVALGLVRVLQLRPRWSAGTPILLAVPLMLVLSLGQPYLVNHSRTPGWDSVSEPWQQAQRYLADHQDGRTTLVVPGTGFAQNTWGWTLDEPLLVLGGVDRVARSQVPLIPGQSIRFLDSLDQLTSSGHATGSLKEQLARAGIGHVVIRRDLLRNLTGSPQPGYAAASLAAGGLTSVARFGGDVDGGSEVEVLAVPDRLPELRATAVSDVLTVRGAPESVLAVQDSGLVSPGRATVLEGEPGWKLPSRVVTDGDQRRERAFGVSEESVSAVMGPDDDWRTARAVHNYPTVPDAHQVVARYDGLRSVTASSSQGYADNFGPIAPQAAPYAAVDGDPSTRWITSSATDPVGQWLRLTFDEPRPVRQVTILPVVDDANVVPIRMLQVRAGNQRVTARTSPSGVGSVVGLDGTEVTSVEIRVLRAGTRSDQARIGLREVSIDGLEMRRTLVVPGDVDAEAAWVFATPAERRACVITLGLPDCNVARIRAAEERDGMDRTFTVAGVSATKVRGRVVARSTPGAARLLDPVGDTQQVGATSFYGADPRVSGRFAYDGQLTTAWVSDDTDENPTLIFRWAQKQRITGISVAPSTDGPTGATLVAPGRDEAVSFGGTLAPVLSGPIVTRRLEVRFARPTGAEHVVVPELALTGAEVTRPLLADTLTGSTCGLGPNVEVDGQRVSTRVRGTVADVINGTPLKLAGCLEKRGPQRLVLGTGQHRLTAPPTAEFQVTQLAGVPDSLRDPKPAATPRDVTVHTWGRSNRTAAVAAGVESLISFPENFNPGWVATADGRELTPIRVDGWQQGWVLPAGGVEKVQMDYRPQAGYLVLLGIGLAVSGLVLLAGLVMLMLLRRRPAPRLVDWPPPPPSGTALPTAVALLLVGLVLLGPAAAVGLAAGMVVGRQDRGRWSLHRAALGAAGLVIASAVVDVLALPGWADTVGDGFAALAVGLLAGTVVRPVRRVHRQTRLVDAP